MHIPMPQKKVLRWGALALGLVLLFIAIALNPFGAPGTGSEPERFVVPLDAEKDALVERLYAEGFIKSAWAFSVVHPGDIAPGAYRLASAMNAFEVARAFTDGPYMKWVVIPEGYRKEEIAELLAEELSWSRDEVRQFVGEDTNMGEDLVEGVYFPDTYLIPFDEETAQVAARLHARFNERFAPYAEEALAQNIRWPTLLKIASLIQREAAGQDDMGIISGVIWNRLLAGQRLEIDATVQYARDTFENYDIEGTCAPDSGCTRWQERYTGEGAAAQGFWRPISATDKQIGAYNTYRQSGVPSRPIANPGLAAIEAALYPQETDCFFYLHDADGNIHCAPTFAEHEANIERYLR